MTEKNNHDMELHSPLISDEEFVALMDNRYHAQGRPQNDIAKQKLWNTLETNLPDNTPSRRQPYLYSQISRKVSETITNIISVAAAAVLLLSIVPLFSDNRLFTGERSKGLGDFPLVNISAFVVKDDGELQLASGLENKGTTIVFKVDTPKPTSVVLAMSKAGEPPQVRFRAGVLPSGVGQLLKTDDRVYGYELERGDQNLKICAIASDDEKTLNRRLRLITRVWNNLPSASCVMINVK